MKNAVLTALATSSLFFATNARADLSDVPSGDYGLDKTHAYITLTYSHLGFSTPHVGFDSFELNLALDSDTPENSRVEVVIDVTSINSRVEKFDDHLNSADFFDTASFPEATFKSTSIERTGENTYNVTGDLTIMDVTKSIVLATTINKAAVHPMSKVPTVGMSGEATISRSELGLARAVPNVGDTVTIYVTAEMPLKSP